MSVETLINALHAHKLHAVGRDRYRAVCPVCGERNPNTLSIGVNAEGAALVKCWKLGCDVGSICASLGLDVSDLFPPRASYGGPMKRRRPLSASQALELLHDEAQLIALCGSNIARGVELTDDDRDRCLTAAGRIAYLCDEVHA